MSCGSGTTATNMATKTQSPLSALGMKNLMTLPNSKKLIKSPDLIAQSSSLMYGGARHTNGNGSNTPNLISTQHSSIIGSKNSSNILERQQSEGLAASQM
jgi:hypothetical protein